jgi:hypothetical protein
LWVRQYASINNILVKVFVSLSKKTPKNFSTLLKVEFFHKFGMHNANLKTIFNVIVCDCDVFEKKHYLKKLFPVPVQFKV